MAAGAEAGYSTYSLSKGHLLEYHLCRNDYYRGKGKDQCGRDESHQELHSNCGGHWPAALRLGGKASGLQIILVNDQENGKKYQDAEVYNDRFVDIGRADQSEHGER